MVPQRRGKRLLTFESWGLEEGRGERSNSFFYNSRKGDASGDEARMDMGGLTRVMLQVRQPRQGKLRIIFEEASYGNVDH